jgi:hypothetical protein
MSRLVYWQCRVEGGESCLLRVLRMYERLDRWRWEYYGVLMVIPEDDLHCLR